MFKPVLSQLKDFLTESSLCHSTAITVQDIDRNK